MQNKIELLEHRLEAAEQRLASAEGELFRVKRRVRATWACAFAGVLGVFVLGSNPAARAQFGDGNPLKNLQSQINALITGTSHMETRVTALESKTQFVSVSGGDMLVTNTNLYIQNGLGATNGNPAAPFDTNNAPVNGKGNLIIGYNASRTPLSYFGPDARGGSHNLVLGDANNYTRYGGIVAGAINTISGAYASASGGAGNTAAGYLASVSGGSFNIVSGDYASASGGYGNAVAGAYASASGGYINIVSGDYASVSGGERNTASGLSTSISGGQSNTASGLNASVSGGIINTAGGAYAAVSGGQYNMAVGAYASASGGYGNTAGGEGASVSGGTGITQSSLYGWSGGSQSGANAVGNFRSP